MIGVLVMAYGGPDRLEDVEPYLLDVRHHRPTPPELVEAMRARYQRIGGRSPILERTRAQAAALESALLQMGIDCRAWVGMRHWHPYIDHSMRSMEAAGIRRAVGVVMAPHYSRMSIGAYAAKVREANSAIDVRLIESWHLMPEYIATVIDRVDRALKRFPEPARHSVPIIFTAHSLPERILAEGDPYAEQFAATVDALRARLDGRPVHRAWQSAAATPEPWLGPDAGEVLEQLAAAGETNVLMAPIGFTSEHVEILYDIDVEYREQARRLGLRLERIDMMNDHPLMMRGLARLVRGELEQAGWNVTLRVAVIGGGLAGLTAAWRLLHPPAAHADVSVKVTLLEAADRTGGLIRTERQDGFLLEAGADSFVTAKPWALALVRELGMADELIGMRPWPVRACVLRDGRLHPFPPMAGLVPAGSRAWLRAGMLRWPGRLRAAAEPLIPPRRSGGEETIRAFLRRRFGREASDWFLEPLLAGVHGGRGESLGLRATFPFLAEAEARARSVMRGVRAARSGSAGAPPGSAFLTFRDGMQRLTDALAAGLAGADVRLGWRAAAVEPSDGAWRVQSAGADEVVADAVVIAVPAAVAAALLGGPAPDAAAQMAGMATASTTVVYLAYDRAAVRSPLEGTGYLVPRLEGRRVAACTWSSSKFDGRAPDGAVLLRVFLKEENASVSDAEASDLARTELAETVGATGAPRLARVFRFVDAMPQYTPGHAERVEAIEQSAAMRAGLFLAGSAWHGVGISDVVRSAERAAAGVLEYLRAGVVAPRDAPPV